MRKQDYRNKTGIRSGMTEGTLQSFRFSAFQRVKEESLTNPNTHKYFKSEAETALFYSLMEVSGNEHYGYIEEVILGSEVAVESQERQEHVKLMREMIARAPPS